MLAATNLSKILICSSSITKIALWRILIYRTIIPVITSGVHPTPVWGGVAPVGWKNTPHENRWGGVLHPKTPPHCGVEFGPNLGCLGWSLVKFGVFGVEWSISIPRFPNSPPHCGVECGVEFLDRWGGVGWSFHPTRKCPMNTTTHAHTSIFVRALHNKPFRLK